MNMRRIVVLFSLLIMLVSGVYAQKAATPKIIFAVLNDGKTLEPITHIKAGKLVPLGEESNGDKVGEFIKSYYKTKTKYNLIFGGKSSGTATVLKNFGGSDCAGNQAEISVFSKTVKPKGFLMALATNGVTKKNVKGIRQKPTAAERREIESLVMAKMKEKKVPIKNTGELRYHNLTKIDVDNDGKYEFVGSYWYNTGAKIRSLMFFIAENDGSGSISIPFSKFEEFEEKDVMSEDINDLDKGIYHELLLDMFDYDGDGQSEIFTLAQGFEGSNFYAYKRVDSKWTQVLETSNYHCGY